MEAKQPEFFSDNVKGTFDTWSIEQLEKKVKALFKGYPDTSLATRKQLIEILEGEIDISSLTENDQVDENIEPKYNVSNAKRNGSNCWETGQYG